jgi:hypothetical protein
MTNSTYVPNVNLSVASGEDVLSRINGKVYFVKYGKDLGLETH